MVNARFQYFSDPSGQGWKIHEALNVEALEMLEPLTGIPTSTWALDVAQGVRVFLFARVHQPRMNNFVARISKSGLVVGHIYPSQFLRGERPVHNLVVKSVSRCADGFGDGAMAPVDEEMRKTAEVFCCYLAKLERQSRRLRR
jgi:hypothetical protein